jgi:hypothetical protein
VPQWLRSFERFVSQPLAKTPSQSAKPELQAVIVHTPATQAADNTCGPGGHWLFIEQELAAAEAGPIATE